MRYCAVILLCLKAYEYVCVYTAREIKGEVLGLWVHMVANTEDKLVLSFSEQPVCRNCYVQNHWRMFEADKSCANTQKADLIENNTLGFQTQSTRRRWWCAFRMSLGEPEGDSHWSPWPLYAQCSCDFCIALISCPGQVRLLCALLHTVTPIYADPEIALPSAWGFS